MERRKFLRYTSATVAAPFFFQGQWIQTLANQSAFDVLRSFNPNRKLILIQLDGGNDGLNMVIPISQYDNLANARRNILVDQAKILKLTDETGLNPAMPELTNLYKEGKVQIIQGVGYPNPNLSHFRSKDIVISASDSKTVISSGWTGRMFGKQYPDFPVGFPNEKQPHPIALTLGSTSSAIFQGDLANYSTVLKNLSSTYSSTTPTVTYPETPFGNELKFITNVMEQTESYLSVIKSAASSAKNLSALYPASGSNSLADQLKLVANLIAGGLQTQIYVVSLGGWDLHSSAVASEADKLTGAHPTLLSKLSKAIAAFQDDLKLLNKADEVMGFVFTEFGRRIKSNDSLGTDHGTSWPAIVFGTKVNSGIIGNNPVIPINASKSDNLAMQYDFRSIYAGFFKQWFSLDGQDVTQLLGANFPEVQVISKSTSVKPEIALSEKMKLYPNQMFDPATLPFETAGDWTQIRVFSVNGQLIENLQRQQFPKGLNQIQLDFGFLKSGTYLLELQQKSNRESIRFVVN